MKQIKNKVLEFFDIEVFDPSLSSLSLSSLLTTTVSDLDLFSQTRTASRITFNKASVTLLYILDHVLQSSGVVFHAATRTFVRLLIACMHVS
jgi:hypothetical protein